MVGWAGVAWALGGALPLCTPPCFPRARLLRSPAPGPQVAGHGAHARHGAVPGARGEAAGGGFQGTRGAWGWRPAGVTAGPGLRRHSGALHGVRLAPHRRPLHAPLHPRSTAARSAWRWSATRRCASTRASWRVPWTCWCATRGTGELGAGDAWGEERSLQRRRQARWGTLPATARVQLERHLHGTSPLPTHPGCRLKSAQGNKTISSLTALNCPRRVLLTGTPIQNDLTEFYAMVGPPRPLVCGFVCSPLWQGPMLWPAQRAQRRADAPSPPAPQSRSTLCAPTAWAPCRRLSA